MTPRWVPKSAVLAIHDMLIAEHRGAPGLLSDSVLETSLASPRNLLAYGSPDLFDLAAKYAASLTLNHPFRDGNKRIALTVAGVFLELNGMRLNATETDAVNALLALSTKALDEVGFAAWLRTNSSAVRSQVRRPARPARRSGTARRPRVRRKRR
jgi:death-on-curing protein